MFSFEIDGKCYKCQKDINGVPHLYEMNGDELIIAGKSIGVAVPTEIKLERRVVSFGESSLHIYIRLNDRIFRYNKFEDVKSCIDDIGMFLEEGVYPERKDSDGVGITCNHDFVYIGFLDDGVRYITTQYEFLLKFYEKHKEYNEQLRIYRYNSDWECEELNL